MRVIALCLALWVGRYVGWLLWVGRCGLVAVLGGRCRLVAVSVGCCWSNCCRLLAL